MNNQNQQLTINDNADMTILAESNASTSKNRNEKRRTQSVNGSELTRGNKKLRDILFCSLVLLYPTLQFLVFYVGVNFNSVLLAFKEWDFDARKFTWAGLANFKEAVYNIFNAYELQMGLKNSFMTFLITFIVGSILALMFSYYMYEKQPLHKFFKVMLFMPCIISPLVLMLLFKFVASRVYPNFVAELVEAFPAFMENVFHVTEDTKILGLLDNPRTIMGTLIAFSIWSSFGVNVLIYSGAMSGINESIVEQSEIDGANQWQKFIHIILPRIYPTFTTFVVAGLTSIFTNQLSLYTLWATGAEYKYYTIGYYIYTKTVQASTPEYPYLAAVGLLFSFVCIPMVFIVKRLMENFGPSDD